MDWQWGGPFTWKNKMCNKGFPMKAFHSFHIFFLFCFPLKKRSQESNQPQSWWIPSGDTKGPICTQHKAVPSTTQVSLLISDPRSCNSSIQRPHSLNRKCTSVHLSSHGCVVVKRDVVRCFLLELCYLEAAGSDCNFDQQKPGLESVVQYFTGILRVHQNSIMHLGRCTGHLLHTHTDGDLLCPKRNRLLCREDFSLTTWRICPYKSNLQRCKCTWDLKGMGESIIIRSFTVTPKTHSWLIRSIRTSIMKQTPGEGTFSTTTKSGFGNPLPKCK